MQPGTAKTIIDVGGIDHRWLRNHLGWPLRGDEEITARSISHSDGLMGSVHRISCAGRSVILKGPPSDPGALGGLVLDTGLLAREVQSYRLLRERGAAARKVSPECYWSALGPDGRGVLVLEDLGPAAPLSTVMASGLSHAEAVAAARSLAVVHSVMAIAGADPLLAPYPWLYSAGSAGLAAWIRLGLEDLPRIMADCWPGRVPGDELQLILDADVETVLIRSHSGANCVSLCHGDAWAGNIIFVPPGRPGEQPAAYLIDWQFAMWGNPLSDVALLLWSSLAPAAREAWEEEILRHYHSELTAHCRLDYPLDACRSDYRRAEPFSLLVALATVEGYTAGMSQRDISQFGRRVVTAVDRIVSLAQDGAWPLHAVTDRP